MCHQIFYFLVFFHLEKLCRFLYSFDLFFDYFFFVIRCLETLRIANDVMNNSQQETNKNREKKRDSKYTLFYSVFMLIVARLFLNYVHFCLKIKYYLRRKKIEVLERIWVVAYNGFEWKLKYSAHRNKNRIFAVLLAIIV